MTAQNKAPTKAQKTFSKRLIKEVERLQTSKGITREEFTESYNEMILFLCGHLLNSTDVNQTAIQGTNDKGNTLIIAITKKDLTHD